VRPVCVCAFGAVIMESSLLESSITSPAVERRLKFAEWKERRRKSVANEEDESIVTKLKNKLASQISAKHKLSQELESRKSECGLLKDKLNKMEEKMKVLKDELDLERNGQTNSVRELHRERRAVSKQLFALTNENMILHKTNQIIKRRLSEESTRNSVFEYEQQLQEDTDEEDEGNLLYQYKSLKIDYEELKQKHTVVRAERDILNVRLEKLLLRRFGASMVSWLQRTRERRVERVMVFRELLESEKQFERDMRLLREHFFEPLRSKRDYVTLANELFGCVDAVIFVSQKIQKHLSITNEDNAMQAVSTLFSEQGIIFKASCRAYSEYYTNYHVMSRQLRTYRREDTYLNEFFISKQSEIPELEGRDVDSLIVLPVQRLPRYGILLKKMKKLTPVHDSWNRKLQIALTQVLRLLDYCDGALDRRRRQSFHDKFGALSVLEMLSHGEGCGGGSGGEEGDKDVKTTTTTLPQKKRRRRKSDVRNVRLLLSGTLLKFGKIRWSDRVCWIFEDTFVYTENSRIKGNVSLRGASVKWFDNDLTSKAKRFDIFGSDGTKLSFETSSVPERDIWVRVLSRAIMIQIALHPIQSTILKSGTLMKKDLITGEWSVRNCKLSVAGLVFTRTYI